MRIVCRMMALNDIVEKDSYTAPTIGRTRENAGPEIFLVIDLKGGHRQQKIGEQDRHKTAFQIGSKVCEWNALVMGFKNSPMIFQRMMDNILRDLRKKGVEVYQDDIIMHSRTVEENRELVWEVMQRLHAKNIRVSKEKMRLFKKEALILGQVLDGSGRQPNEIKRNEALEYPKPKTVTQLRSYLGMAGAFRDYIPNFGVIEGRCLRRQGTTGKRARSWSGARQWTLR